MASSVVTDMNPAQNRGVKQSVNGGSGGGRRKTKGRDSRQKKNKQPQRGMSVEKLERIRLQGQLQTSFNSSLGFTTSGVPNVAGVHFRPAAHVPSPAMLVQGIGIHGPNLYSTDHAMDHLRFENSKELSSISNYMKCGSDGCALCHKKKRINGGSNPCSVIPFRSFCGNHTVVEMMEAGKTRRSSGQVTEVMSVHRNGGGSVTEYGFFPGKSGGAAEEYKEFLRMGSPTTWCGSGGTTSVAGGIGLRGGEGSCVTAITGGEEGSVSSVDLSLKLSY